MKAAPAVAILALAGIVAVGRWLATGGDDAAHDAPAGGSGREADRSAGADAPSFDAASSAAGGDRGAVVRSEQPSSSTSLDLHGARPVVGVLRFANGTPAVHAWIAAAPDDGGPTKDRELYAESEAEGRYSIALPPGRFTLAARHDRTGAARATVVVERGDGEVAGPALVLDEGGIVLGRVFENDGTPLPDVQVHASAESGAVRFTTDHGTPIHVGCDDALTDASGSFRLRGLDRDVRHVVTIELPPGRDLRAEPPRFEDVLPGGAPLVFTVTARRAIEGVVIAADTRAPIASFRIDGRHYSDARGHFEVAIERGVAPTFEALGFVTQERDDLRLKQDERRFGLVVEMQRAAESGTLVVRATDERGTALSAFVVHLNRFGADWELPVEAKDGAANLPSVDVGDWHGVVRAPGHGAARFEANVANGVERAVDVTLPRGAAVDVEVQDADGAPWSGDLAIVGADGAGPEWRFVPRERSRSMPWVREVEVAASTQPARCTLEVAAGRIEGLAAGRYVLIVHAAVEDRRVPFEVFAETPGAVRVKL